MSKHHNLSPDQGFSLLEMLVCLSILAILSSISMPLLERQIAQMRLLEVIHTFIADAQLTRQYSRSLQTEVRMRPIQRNDWSHGWLIETSHLHLHHQQQHHEVTVLKRYPSDEQQSAIHFIKTPQALLKTSQQFTDTSSPQKAKHLTFKNGQAAKLHNGGFVANRIIWQHLYYPELIRHIILGPGGRWRVCQPKEDNQACLAN